MKKIYFVIFSLFILISFVSSQEIIEPLASIENNTINMTGNSTDEISLPDDLSIETLIVWVIALGVLAIIFIVFVGGIYIYQALAYVKIATRTNTKDGWISWIPFVGTWIVAAKVIKAKWWPIFLPFIFVPLEFSIGMLELINEPGSTILSVISVLEPLAEITLIIGPMIFLVFFIIWHWKLFQIMNMSGVLSLLFIIPIIGQIIFLVLIGIAAWIIKKEPKSNNF